MSGPNQAVEPGITRSLPRAQGLGPGGPAPSPPTPYVMGLDPGGLAPPPPSHCMLGLGLEGWHHPLLPIACWDWVWRAGTIPSFPLHAGIGFRWAGGTSAQPRVLGSGTPSSTQGLGFPVGPEIGEQCHCSLITEFPAPWGALWAEDTASQTRVEHPCL